MCAILTTILAFAACALALLVLIFVVEVAAASFSRRIGNQVPPPGDRGTAAVLIPAHNEGKDIERTIKDVQAQLGPGDRLLVVADNCDDDTSAVARAAGAEVIERHDPQRRGKGYALDFGIRHLSGSPPKTLIVIDADCRLAPQTIEQLAVTCAAKYQPVQALDLMVAPSETSLDYRLAEFAWRVKNWVRPLGLRALGLPCQLMGTGMAFPWPVIRDVELASGHIVEDLKLGLELTAAGHAPLFWPSAVVVSEFPSTPEAAERQRERWEGGHLRTIVATAIPLVIKAHRQKNGELLALALDMAVPPLTFLALLVGGLFGISSVGYAIGCSSAPFVISTITLAAFFAAVGLCWFKFGRDLMTVRSLGALGPFVSNKVRLYGGILRGRTPSQWTRTDRRKSGDEST